MITINGNTKSVTLETLGKFRDQDVTFRVQISKQDSGFVKVEFFRVERFKNQYNEDDYSLVLQSSHETTADFWSTVTFEVKSLEHARTIESPLGWRVL